MKRNESNPDELTARQARAVEALLREPTTKAAAKAAGVGEAPLWRWLNEPGFAATYRAARARLVEGTLTALQGAGVSAVELLCAVIKDADAPVSVRVSAAKIVLDAGFRAKQEIENDERLRDIERRLGIAGQTYGGNLQ